MLSFSPDKIEQWPLDRLRPYAQNAKQHGEEQVAKIAASMAEFGWTVPCLVAEDGELIAGHGRVLAAERLGLTEAPVIVLEHLTEDQRRAYRIADNKLTELGEWDEATLAAELQDLIAADFDVTLTGFGDDEIDAMLNELEAEATGGGSGGASSRQDGPPRASLADRFGIPPFSVLNARDGWWQARKAAWLALGIKSELGRGEGDRACPGGSPLPGKGSRADYEPGKGKRETASLKGGLTYGTSCGPYDGRDEKRRRKKKADAKAYHDGTVKGAGKGGLADQMAAQATERNKPKRRQGADG